MPVGFGIVGVAARAPRIDLGLEECGVGNAAGKALARKNREFGLGQIEPAAVLGRVVPFEPLDDAARFGRLEGFVKRCWRVRIQVVLNQDDLVGLGEVDVAQVAQDLRVVDRRASLGDFDMTPAVMAEPCFAWTSGANSMNILDVPLRLYS